LDIEKKLEGLLVKNEDGKYEDFVDFYKNERYIFQSHKANLKNFLDIKYEADEENENFEKQININNIDNKDKIEKAKKDNNYKIKEDEEDQDNHDRELIHEDYKEDIISNLSSDNEQSSSSSDSSFIVVCQRNSRKRYISNNPENTEKVFKPIDSSKKINFHKNIEQISLNNDSIQYKETEDLTPKKPNIFDALFDSEVKYQVFEEKQDGFYSDNFRNVFISDNESNLSDNENNKNKFNKFNLDLKLSRKDFEEININNISRIEEERSELNITNNKSIFNFKKDMDEIENFCKRIKAKKKFLIVREDKINKTNKDRAFSKRNKHYKEDKDNISSTNITHLGKSLVKNAKEDDIYTINLIDKQYKSNSSGEEPSVKNIIFETPLIQKKCKSKFSIKKKKIENNILIKNFNINLTDLSRFEQIKDDNLNLKKLEPKNKTNAFITRYDIKEKIKKKTKVEKTKYPDFKENLKRVYDQKKRKTNDFLKKKELFSGIKYYKRNTCKSKYFSNPYESNLNQVSTKKQKKFKNPYPLSSILSKKRPDNRNDLYYIDKESEMQIDNLINPYPRKSKSSKNDMNNTKKMNLVQDDDVSQNSEDFSNNFLDIAKNRKAQKKSTSNSKNNPFDNQNNFYDSTNNSINLFKVRDYVNNKCSQPNKTNVLGTEDKNDWNDKSSNYLFVKQLKQNTINFAFSDNSSVFSSERSGNFSNITRERTSMQNVKNNLNKKNNVMKNHQIQDFFYTRNPNKEKEEELLRTLLKLFTNEKYSKLLILLDNNREILSSISSSVLQYSDKIISEFNIINEDIVYLEGNKVKEDSFDEFVYYLDSSRKLDFKLNSEESFRTLFGFYKDNVIDFINLFYYDNEDEDGSNRNLIKINEEEKMKECIDRLVMAENIIKTFIKQSDQIINITIENHNDKYSFINIPLKNIKELFLFFLKKVLLDHNFFKENAFNMRNSSLEYSDLNIFSDFLIKRLGVFILMIDNFVNIQTNLIKLINTNKSDQSRKLTNDLNSFVSLFNQFLVILAFFVLIKMYGLDFSELNMKKFDKNKLSQNFQYMSLLKIISESLSRLDPSKKNKKIESDLLDTILSLLKKITNDYLLVGMNSDANSNFEFEDILNSKNNKNPNNKKDEKNKNENIINNNSKNFLRNMKLNFNSIMKNIIYENVVNKEVLNKKFKSTLYKIFICLTNNIMDSGSLSTDIKKFIHNEPLIDLYRRYLNVLLIIFFDSDFKNSKSIFFEELLDKNVQFPDANRIDKMNQANIYSYYDLDNIIKNLNNHELRNKINFLKKSNLFNDYLISDLKTLIIFDKYWKIEPIIIIKNIFLLFNIMNSKHRRHKESECLKQNKFMYKLIDFLFLNRIEKDKGLNKIDEISHGDIDEESLVSHEDDEEDFDYFQTEINFPQHLEFIFKVSRLIRKMLSSCKEEKNKKKILSLFVNQYSAFSNKNSIYKDNIIEDNPPKLNSLCILCVVFSFVEFANSFDNKEDIELSLKRLKDILDFSKSSIFIKGINIAMTIKIVLNDSRRNISLMEPIISLNNQMRYIYDQINHFQILNNKKSLNDSLQNNRYIDSDFLKNEIFPTLHFLLNNLLTISKEKTEIIVNNPSILDEIKNLLKSDLKIAINYKQILINIISNCMDKCEEIIKDNIKNNAFIEEDGMIFDIPIEFFLEDENEIRNSFCQNDFSKKIKNDFIPILNKLIYSLILENKANSGTLGQTLSFPFLKSAANCFTKICTLLYKYQMIPSSIFIEKFDINSGFFSSNLRKMLSNNPRNNINLNITNGELLDGITQIPFMAIANFLKFNRNIVVMDLRKEKDFLISLLKMLFHVLFYNSYYQNSKLTYEVFSRMTQTNEGKYCNTFVNKRETEIFINELLKFLCVQRAQAHQIIIDIKREMHANSLIKRDDLNYLNLIMFFSEEIILDLVKNIFKSSNNFCELFEIFFSEYLNLDERSNNPIELKFFITLIKGLEEIIHRGMSLENIRKNKNLLANDFNSENYCFIISNFYFKILKMINIKDLFVYSKINQNRILIDFVDTVQKSIGVMLSDFNFKELTYKKLTIGFNIFTFSGEIVDLVLNDTGRYKEIKDKNYVEKVDFFISTFSNSINYLVYRIKEFFDYYLYSNIDILENILEKFKLKFTDGFSYDYYFIKEKLKFSKQKSKKVFLTVVDGKFSLNLNREYMYKNADLKCKSSLNYNENTHFSTSPIQMELDSEGIHNLKDPFISYKLFDNKDDLILNDDDNQVYELILKESNSTLIDKNKNNQRHYINQNNDYLNQDTNINRSSNNVFTQNLDVDFNMNELNNLLKIDDEPGLEINQYKLNDNNSDHNSNSIREFWKQKIIKNMISIIKYISSKKYLYDYSFSSKSYYLFTLFISHKIINNYIDEQIFSRNIQNLLICLNFSKYPILRFEDLYLNIHIIKILELSIDYYHDSSKDKRNMNTNKKVFNQSSSNKFNNELYFNFIQKTLEFILEILNFFAKYCISLNKFNKINDPFVFLNGKKFFLINEKKLNSINSYIEKALKQIFGRECTEIFKHEKEIIIPQEALNHENNSTLKIFYLNKSQMIKNVLASIKNINKSIKFLLMNHSFSLFSTNNSRTFKFQLVQIIENNLYMVDYLNKVFDINLEEERKVDKTDNKSFLLRDKFSFNHQKKRYFDDFYN